MLEQMDAPVWSDCVASGACKNFCRVRREIVGFIEVGCQNIRFFLPERVDSTMSKH